MQIHVTKASSIKLGANKARYPCVFYVRVLECHISPTSNHLVHFLF